MSWFPALAVSRCHASSVTPTVEASAESTRRTPVFAASSTRNAVSSTGRARRTTATPDPGEPPPPPGASTRRPICPRACVSTSRTAMASPVRPVRAAGSTSSGSIIRPGTRSGRLSVKAGSRRLTGWRAWRARREALSSSFLPRGRWSRSCTSPIRADPGFCRARSRSSSSDCRIAGRIVGDRRRRGWPAPSPRATTARRREGPPPHRRPRLFDDRHDRSSVPTNPWSSFVIRSICALVVEKNLRESVLNAWISLSRRFARCL